MSKKRHAAPQWPSFRRYTTVARDAARASVEQHQSLANSIWCGDCRDVLRDKFHDDYFDLIVTSPPYAEARKSTYGGIHADRYAAWMLERTSEFLRVLKPTGTFILNIKEKVIDGERHTYVIDLIKGCVHRVGCGPRSSSGTRRTATQESGRTDSGIPGNGSSSLTNPATSRCARSR